MLHLISREPVCQRFRFRVRFSWCELTFEGLFIKEGSITFLLSSLLFIDTEIDQAAMLPSVDVTNP